MLDRFTIEAGLAPLFNSFSFRSNTALDAKPVVGRGHSGKKLQRSSVRSYRCHSRTFAPSMRP